MVLEHHYQALADPSRRRILELLGRGDLPAGEIADQFDMTWPSVSRHLGILKAAELVTARREGTNIVYSLTPSAVQEVIADLRALARTDGQARHRLVLATLGLRGGVGGAGRGQDESFHNLLLRILPQESYELIRIPSERFGAPDKVAGAIILESPHAVGVIANFEAHVLVPELIGYLREGGLGDVPLFLAGDFHPDISEAMTAHGVGALLFGGYEGGAFIKWLDAALVAADARRAMEKEMREAFSLGLTLSSVTAMRWPRPGDSKSAERTNALESLVRQELADAGIQTVDIDETEEGVKVRIRTSEPGRLVGKMGKNAASVKSRIEELTGKAVTLNVLADK
jgi:ArsR family transcriptional regulator